MTRKTDKALDEASSFFRSLTRVVLTCGILPGLVALAACEGSQPRERQPDPETQEPEVVEGSECDTTGLWKLEESPEAEQGCDSETSWAPFVDARLEVSQPGEFLEVTYVPDESAAMTCSGTPSDDRCALEMTCMGTVRDERVEASLQLAFDAGSGTLSGTRTFDIVETGCSMTVSIDGRRADHSETKNDGG